MKKLALLLIGLVLGSLSFADCAASGIWVYPKTEVINKNSFIIAEGYAYDQETVRGIGANFTAQLVSKNHTIELEIIKTYEGMFQLTRVVLKPTSELLEGQTYQLEIVSADGSKDFSPTRYNNTSKKWDSVKWKVGSDSDKTKPKWISPPKHKDNSWVGFGCGPAINATFTAEVEDDSETFVEVEFKNVQLNEVHTYLVELNGDIFDLGHGMCSGAFRYSKENKDKYQARFKLYDICGNQDTNWTDWITFDNPNGASGW